MVDTITNKELLSLISQNIERPFFSDYLEDLESLWVFFLFHLIHFFVISRSIQSTFFFLNQVPTYYMPATVNTLMLKLSSK